MTADKTCQYISIQGEKEQRVKRTDTTRNTDESGHGGEATRALRGTVLDKCGSPCVLAAVLVDNVEGVLQELYSD